MRRLVAGILFLACLASATQAFAHASLLSTDPADGDLVPFAPDYVTLTFNETVQPLVLRLIDSDGGTKALGVVARHGSSLVVAPPPGMRDGTYLLSWRVISADGHPVGGSFIFSVGHASASSPTVSEDTEWPVRAAIWLARIVIYAGLFVGIGGAFFLAWLTSGAAPSFVDRTIAIVSLVALAGVASAVGLQGLDALAAPLSSLWQWPIWVIGAKTTLGRSAALAAISLIFALVSLRRRKALAKVFSLLALAGVGAALAATGHAASATPRFVTVPAVFLHAAAIAFWIGALIPLFASLAQTDRRALEQLRRFSNVVPLAIAVLVASGAVLAAIQLQHVNALWTSTYGVVLTAKLAMLCLLFALAAYNRYWLAPAVERGEGASLRRLRHSIVVEIAIAFVIMSIVALWRFTPPPRALAAASESYFTHVHSERAMASVTVAPARPGPVNIAIYLQRPDEQVLDAKELAVSLSNPSAGIEPVVRLATLESDGQWHVHNVTLPVIGQWTLDLTVVISDFDEVEIRTPVVIGR